MTIDAEKLADIAIDAVFEDYEDSGIFSKDRAKEAAKKALTAHLKPKVPGGYGIGAYVEVTLPADGYFKLSDVGATFQTFGDAVHVYRNAQMRCVDPPLLPDVD